MLFETMLTITLLTKFLEGTVFNFYNGRSKFSEFKNKFKKAYANIKEEQASFGNFLDNLNRVAALNENSTDSKAFYVLNKYADLNPAQVEERYSINLKPYNKVIDGDMAELLRSNQGVEISSSKLFDLNYADDLYEQFKTVYAKNATKKRDRAVSYYRFVKTLVEKNRDIFEGKDDGLELGEEADVVKHKDQFFY